MLLVTIICHLGCYNSHFLIFAHLLYGALFSFPPVARVVKIQIRRVTVLLQTFHWLPIPWIVKENPYTKPKHLNNSLLYVLFHYVASLTSCPTKRLPLRLQPSRFPAPPQTAGHPCRRAWPLAFPFAWNALLSSCSPTSFTSVFKYSFLIKSSQATFWKSCYPTLMFSNFYLLSTFLSNIYQRLL